MANAAQALLETPLGSSLSAGEAADLAQAASQRTIPRGSYLFRAGDQGSALYIILSGSLDVMLGPAIGGTVVASLGPGQVVGELEVMTGTARVAGLVATDECNVLELPAARFDEMLKANRPGAVKLVTNIAKALARRLTAANQRLTTRSPAPAAAHAPAEPQEIVDTDLVPVVDDEDLAVLDKLWS
jgi:CRP-like cAMP-binding protein